MPKIFISYRRADSADIAGRITDHLRASFGDENVFFDVDDIVAGTNFSTYILNKVRDSDVMLVIIGKEWIDIRDSEGVSRLDSPNDWVRLEIENALSSSKPIIPVLVRDARMPSPDSLPPSLRQLSLYQAVQIPSSAEFRLVIHKLIDYLKSFDRTLKKKTPKAKFNIGELRHSFASLNRTIGIRKSGGRNSIRTKWILATFLLLVSTALFAWMVSFQTPRLPSTPTLTLSIATATNSSTPTQTATMQPTAIALATRHFQGTALQYVLDLTATNVASGALVPTSNQLNQPNLLIERSLLLLGGLAVATVAILGYRRFFARSGKATSLARTSVSQNVPEPVIDSKVSQKVESRPAPSVFVSYRRRTSAMLANLVKYGLEKEAITVFVDTFQQDGAGPFPTYLYDVIEKHDIFVCLVSDKSFESEWVPLEIQQAHKLKKPMIPVLQESYKDLLRKKGAYQNMINKLKDDGIDIDAIEGLLRNKAVHMFDINNVHIDVSISDLVKMIRETHKSQ